MPGQYDNSDSGALFRNQKRTSDKSPVMTGKLEIGKATLKALVEAYQQTGKAELRVAAWPMKSDDRNLTFKLSLPDEQRSEQSSRGFGGGQGRTRGGGGYQGSQQQERRPAPRQERSYDASEYEETPAGFGGRRKEQGPKEDFSYQGRAQQKGDAYIDPEFDDDLEGPPF